jgi:hypothetical protein
VMLVKLVQLGGRVAATAARTGRTVVAPEAVIADALELLQKLGSRRRTGSGEFCLLELQKPQPVVGTGVDTGGVVVEHGSDYRLRKAEPVGDDDDTSSRWVPRIVGDLDGVADGHAATKDEPIERDVGSLR